ncbi:GNAT family N-acetyltransferase [Palleronia sediminis]|uniref:L-ornithine N(alpha)-acyltransferase n=1 Tax=Palleronia sediminis TaxID=2547833 RepID=A0A4R6AIF0_9RHOB|nr:GNAT family N-acyltransferase [Palleronia sediminis]TDL83720.1 GNAT family N-acetyltransferase [Palleronia sediminis]
MSILTRGRFAVREARGPADLAAAMALRRAVFRADRAGPEPHDAICRHMLVEDARDGAPVATFRVLRLASGAELDRSLAARSYGLARLEGFGQPMLELGRFCAHPARGDADILRVAWGALTRIVDREGIGMLFGCASFPGTDPAPHRPALDWLGAHHLAPAHWRPERRAAGALPLVRGGVEPEARRAMVAMPPLLRTYLAMGGWVSDHAVIDPAMGTLHVFTAVEIAAIPPARQRLLRAVAG